MTQRGAGNVLMLCLEYTGQEESPMDADKSRDVVRATLFVERRILRALKLLAVQRDTTLRVLVNEGLREWLLQQEDQEERDADDAAHAAMMAARAQGEQGIPWEQVKAMLESDIATKEAAEATGELAS